MGSRGSLGISAGAHSIPRALDQTAGVSGAPPGYYATGMPWAPGGCPVGQEV